VQIVAMQTIHEIAVGNNKVEKYMNPLHPKNALNVPIISTCKDLLLLLLLLLFALRRSSWLRQK